MITVEKRSHLDALPNKILNEYALVKEEGKIYQYIDNWQPVKIEGEGLKVSLYDINKNIFSQLTPMNDEQLRFAHAEIFKFLGESAIQNENNYWALVCWEERYITIFHDNPDSDEELSDIIMEIIEGLGDVKDVSDNKGGAIEIWISDLNDTNCYLLFNYNQGIVEGVA